MAKRAVIVGFLIATFFSAAAFSADVPKAPNRAEALGKIDSFDPTPTGTAGNVTFIVRSSFCGVGWGPTAEQHTITVRLVVIDEDGNVICTKKQDYDVPDSEHGYIKEPVSYAATVSAGAYFMNATLSDLGPNGKRVQLDAKSAAVILN